LCSAFDEAGLRYALIGGFAVAMRGMQRATVDIDLLVAADDLPTADGVLRSNGFECWFRGENVSHYRNQQGHRIDLLHAFRAHATAMLRRAERLDVDHQLSLPVATVEDLIGLKIQAAFNNPARSTGDWQDIRGLIEAAARRHAPLDWILIEDYLEVFEQTERITEMRAWYGPTD